MVDKNSSVGLLLRHSALDVDSHYHTPLFLNFQHQPVCTGCLFLTENQNTFVLSSMVANLFLIGNRQKN